MLKGLQQLNLNDTIIPTDFKLSNHLQVVVTTRRETVCEIDLSEYNLLFDPQTAYRTNGDS